MPCPDTREDVIEFVEGACAPDGPKAAFGGELQQKVALTARDERAGVKDGGWPVGVGMVGHRDCRS